MNEVTGKRKNPFFEPYNTPHDTAPFNRISMEDYEEAMMEGIRRDKEYLEKTINNPERPTFDNTIINKDDDQEGYYDLLDRVTTVFFNLLSAETNDEMDALAQKMSPILTQHANDMRLNEQLFERVKYVHRHHRRLTPEEKRLLDDCYEGFVRSGALLSKEDKDRLRQLTEEASLLGLQFSQNLLKENKAFMLHLTDSQRDVLQEYSQQMVRKITDTEHHFRKQLLGSIIRSIIYEVSNIIYQSQQTDTTRKTQAETIFTKFIRLVEQNFRSERRVSWYAQQLCITPKYLSETVKAVSKRRPNDWIDNYVTMEIRVMLRNSTMSIKEIAQELNFANQSFLGKYFKEHVGMSPKEYRKK
jgi:Zn-dependent oligopeptidase